MLCSKGLLCRRGLSQQILWRKFSTSQARGGLEEVYIVGAARTATAKVREKKKKKKKNKEYIHTYIHTYIDAPPPCH